MYMVIHERKNNVPLIESGKTKSEIIAIVDKVTRKADYLVFNMYYNITENLAILALKSLEKINRQKS